MHPLHMLINRCSPSSIPFTVTLPIYSIYSVELLRRSSLGARKYRRMCSRYTKVCTQNKMRFTQFFCGRCYRIRWDLFKNTELMGISVLCFLLWPQQHFTFDRIERFSSATHLAFTLKMNLQVCCDRYCPLQFTFHFRNAFIVSIFNWIPYKVD